jgi:DNA repair ATPase RecN
MGTVGKLESCFEQHENLFAEVNNSLLSTEEQLARLWKQTHKLTSLEQQQRQHEAEFQDVQRWRAQLTATRVLEASALKQRLGAFRGFTTCMLLC